MNAKARLAKVQEEIRAACVEAGRDPREVKLLAVGKTKPWTDLLALAEAGQIDFGENYVQEAIDKQATASAWTAGDARKEKFVANLRWHFIGALQSNKAKFIPGRFACVHSLDRLPLVDALDKAAARADTVVSGLAQVNVDAEASKSGLAPHDLLPFLEDCNRFAHVRITGLMCIPNPELQTNDPRAAFARLRDLRDEATRAGAYRGPLSELSMGMSADFAAAIREGSTIVRIGTALFGPREPQA